MQKNLHHCGGQGYVVETAQETVSTEFVGKK
jgi:hypothetical protein